MCLKYRNATYEPRQLPDHRACVTMTLRLSPVLKVIKFSKCCNIWCAITDLERKRLTVPPGITGLWQVTGRSDLGWREGVQLDLEYVSHRSIGFDLRILGRTLGAVIRSSGAY